MKPKSSHGLSEFIRVYPFILNFTSGEAVRIPSVSVTTSPSSPNAVWNDQFVIHVIHCYSRFKCLARSPDHAAQKQLIDEDKVLPHLSTEGLHCDCCCQNMNLLAVVHSVGLVLLADFPVENCSSACGHFLQNTYNPRADLPMI